MVNRKFALSIDLSTEKLTDDKGREYSTFTFEELEYKVYHDLSNRRLEDESKFEYQVRKQLVKEHVKTRGRFIWFSKNNESIRNYKLTKFAKRLREEKGKDTSEIDKKSEEVLDLAKKTNMGTLNKKAIQKKLVQMAEESGLKKVEE